jgi:hemolysin activation/secretion protein
MLSVWAGSAFSQAAPDAGALQRSLEQQIQRETPAPAFPSVKAPETKSTLPSSNQKLTISSFDFTGNTVFTNEELAKVVAPWTGKTIAFGDLKDATAAIQDLYGSRGRIAQALIPPQKITGGKVTIQIIEGKLGKISVSGVAPDQKLRLDLDVAQKYMEHGNPTGQLINTENIDRSLALLNELPGVGATASFGQSQEVGASDLDVRVNDGPFVTGRVEAANYGSNSTGAWQAIGNVTLNNLSGYGDSVALDAIQSLGSSFVQGNYSLPIGYAGWKVGALANFLNYQTLSSWSPTPTTGQATTFALNTSYALERSATSNSNLIFTAQNRAYRNSVPTGTISNYQINNLNAGINGSELSSGGALNGYGLTASYGNLYVDSATQKAQDQAGPNTNGSYFKVTANASRTQPLPIENTNLVMSVNAQWANKNLNSADQLYLGGPYGIRAYPVAQGGGSKGAVGTVELQHNFLTNWQVSAFVDGGIITQYVNTYPGWQGLTNANNTYSLGGYGLGGKYIEQQYNVSLNVAHTIGQNPLYTSSGQQLNTNNSNRAYEAWLKGTLYF